MCIGVPRLYAGGYKNVQSQGYEDVVLARSYANRITPSPLISS